MVDALGGENIEKRFSSLCPSEDYRHSVIVFKNKEISNLLEKARFVVCQNGENTKVFNINPNGGVLVNPF